MPSSGIVPSLPKGHKPEYSEVAIDVAHSPYCSWAPLLFLAILPPPGSPLAFNNPEEGGGTFAGVV